MPNLHCKQVLSSFKSTKTKSNNSQQKSKSSSNQIKHLNRVKNM